MIDEMDYKHEDEIVCPYCGARDSDSWEEADEGEVECDCGGVFAFIRDVSVTYSSYPKTPPE